MNKSLIALSALTVAALTWYVGEHFYAGTPASSSQAQQTALASPAQTEAALATAQTKQQSDAAKLQALLKGQDAAALAAALAAAANAQDDFNSAVTDEYAEAYDAIYNKTDSLFENAKTDPTIIIPTQSATIEAAINAARAKIGALLANWQSSDAPAVVSYLDQLETIVEGLTPQNSGLTQAQINAYEATVEAASLQVTDAISKVASAQAALNLANDEVAVQEAAGNPVAIEQAQQDVENDQDNVAALEAELAAEEAADGNNSANTSGSTTDTSDTNGNNSGNNGGNGDNNPAYFYTSSDIQEQQAEFQQILKNNPPELVNF